MEKYMIVKTIEVTPNGVYASNLEKPIEPNLMDAEYSLNPELDRGVQTKDYAKFERSMQQYKESLTHYTSSLIKVENEGKLSLELIAHAFDFYGEVTNQDERGIVTFKKGTYVAPSEAER